MSAAGVMEALNRSYHDKHGASTSTPVNHWVKFNVRGLHQAAIRILDPNSPLAQRLGEEELVMRFVWWLVTQIGVSPETASEYASTVNAWHRRWTGIWLALACRLLDVRRT